MGVRKNPFDVNRRRAYARSRCQADFRGEAWDLTFSEWCEFWPTPEEFARRGRHSDSLCLTRRDWTLPWNRTNTVKLPRPAQVAIGNRYGRFSTEEYYSQEIARDD